jgi:hypothetical protein
VAILQTEPLGLFSFGARIRAGDREVARLGISFFRSRGSFTLDGEAFLIEPMGFFGSGVILKKGSSVIARVTKPSFFRRRFEVNSAGHRFVLESRSRTGREYVLLLGAQEVGRIERGGFMGKRLKLDFPDEVPLVLQVLLAFVVLAQAKRERAARSG